MITAGVQVGIIHRRLMVAIVHWGTSSVLDVQNSSDSFTGDEGDWYYRYRKYRFLFFLRKNTVFLTLSQNKFSAV
jgi:hypothetical protein